MATPKAKAALDQEYEKQQKLPVWSESKVHSKSRGDTAEIPNKFKKVQRKSGIERWSCERTLPGTTLVLTEQGDSASHLYGGKSPGRDLKIYPFWTSTWCSASKKTTPLGLDRRSSCSAGATLMGKLCWKKDGKKSPGWECRYFHRKMQLFLSLYVDKHRDGGEK